MFVCSSWRSSGDGFRECSYWKTRDGRARSQWTDEEKSIYSIGENPHDEANPPVTISGITFERLGVHPNEIESLLLRYGYGGKSSEAAQMLRASGQVFYSKEWGWVMPRDTFSAIVSRFKDKDFLSSLPIILASAFIGAAASGALSPYTVAESVTAGTSAAEFAATEFAASEIAAETAGELAIEELGAQAYFEEAVGEFAAESLFEESILELGTQTIAETGQQNFFEKELHKQANKEIRKRVMRELMQPSNVRRSRPTPRRVPRSQITASAPSSPRQVPAPLTRQPVAPASVYRNSLMETLYRPQTLSLEPNAQTPAAASPLKTAAAIAIPIAAILLFA